jgi:RNAse (barnase) inhibitor barstar
MSHHHIDRLIRHDDKTPLHVIESTPSAVADLAAALGRESRRKVVARVVRGGKCRTTKALFDEFAAAWQFPPYFGKNWDALDECLSDLEWLPGESYILFVTDSLQILADEKPEVFGLFIEIVEGLAREWNSASFHVVLQADAADRPKLAERLKLTGTKFDVL